MKNCKKIELRKAAEKFIKSRTRKEQIRLLSKINELPAGEQIKKMEGYDNRYRLRVGDFRVIYEIYQEEQISETDGEPESVLIVRVLEAGNRGDVYK